MPSSPLAITKYTWQYWRAQCPALPWQLLNIPGIIGEPNAQLSPSLLQQRLNALDHIHKDLLPGITQMSFFSLFYSQKRNF